MWVKSFGPNLVKLSQSFIKDKSSHFSTPQNAAVLPAVSDLYDEKRQICNLSNKISYDNWRTDCVAVRQRVPTSNHKMNLVQMCQTWTHRINRGAVASSLISRTRMNSLVPPALNELSSLWQSLNNVVVSPQFNHSVCRRLHVLLLDACHWETMPLKQTTHCTREPEQYIYMDFFFRSQFTVKTSFTFSFLMFKNSQLLNVLISQRWGLHKKKSPEK